MGIRLHVVFHAPADDLGDGFSFRLGDLFDLALNRRINLSSDGLFSLDHDIACSDGGLI